MTDLGQVDTLSKVFSDSLEGAHADPLKLKAAHSLALEIGVALGDFMGRYHAWAALPAQSALRERFLENVAGREQCLEFHLTTMAMSADRFSIKEPWVQTVAQEEREEAMTCGQVLSVGDMWLGAPICWY